MSSKLKLDSSGMKQMLSSDELESAVSQAGSAVQRNVGTPTASGKPIPVKKYMGKATINGATRPVCYIVLAHPAAQRVEAKRAPLVRGAEATGLEVTERAND